MNYKKVIWVLIGIASVIGFVIGLQSFMWSVRIFWIFPAKWLGALHITSQIVMVVLFILSLFFVFRKKKN
jgi:uncharacterized membrane protein